MVEQQLPKLTTGVRFPSPAPFPAGDGRRPRMSNHVYPVVASYRSAPGDAVVHSLQVNVVAMDPPRALAQGLLIAKHWLRVQHPSASLLSDRAKCGAAQSPASGPSLILMGTSDIVQSVVFPARIDSEPGERLGEILAGLDAEKMDAVLFNCADLTYMNTVGLTSLAAHVKRLRLHLFQVPEPVMKVFEIVGLSRYLTILPGLEESLAAIPPRSA